MFLKSESQEPRLHSSYCLFTFYTSSKSFKTQEGYKTSDKIPLQIAGGHKFGLRGHAWKTNHQEANYRVLIETSNQVDIGQIDFIIENSNKSEMREYLEIIR